MNLFETIPYIRIIIERWERTQCPDCGAPMKIVMGYFQKCSKKPDEHKLCDNEFYLKKIKEVLGKKCLI